MDSYHIPLTETQLERVKKELDVADGAKFEHSLRLFEEWVSYQTYLPQHYDRVLLKTYLIQCKHDLERAKTKFRKYLVNMSKMTQLFHNRTLCLEPEHAVSGYLHLFPLPEPTPDGYVVFYSKLFNPDPNVFNLRRALQTMTMHFDYRMHRDETTAGYIFVSDSRFMHGGHMPLFLNAATKRYLEIGLESYPLRIKEIHIIATLPIVIHGINILKAILKENLRDRLYVHKNIESITRHVPLKCLPSDYGGGQKSLSELSAEVTELLKSRRDVFERVESLKITGPVPREVDTDCTLEFGMEGSFRQLEVD